MVSHKIRLTYDFALRGVELLIVKDPLLGCKIQEKRSRGGSVPAPLGLEILGPAPSFGLTAFQARCWDCSRSAGCTGGGRQPETPSVSAVCSDGAGVAASEWRPEAKPLLPG